MRRRGGSAPMADVERGRLAAGRPWERSNSAAGALIVRSGRTAGAGAEGPCRPTGSPMPEQAEERQRGTASTGTPARAGARRRARPRAAARSAGAPLFSCHCAGGDHLERMAPTPSRTAGAVRFPAVRPLIWTEYTDAVSRPGSCLLPTTFGVELVPFCPRPNVLQSFPERLPAGRGV